MHTLVWIEFGAMLLFLRAVHVNLSRWERRHNITPVPLSTALWTLGRVFVDTMRWVGRGSANLPPVERRDDDHGPMRQLNTHRLKLPD